MRKISNKLSTTFPMPLAVLPNRPRTGEPCGCRRAARPLANRMLPPASHVADEPHAAAGELRADNEPCARRAWFEPSEMSYRFKMLNLRFSRKTTTPTATSNTAEAVSSSARCDSSTIPAAANVYTAVPGIVKSAVHQV